MLQKIKTVPVIALLLILFMNLFGAFEFKGVGSSYLASGSAGLASENTDFCIFLNPAKLAGMSGMQADLYYRNYYGIKDLNQISLAGRFSIANIPVGLGISRYGNKLYAETEIRMGSGYKIHDDIFFGISLNTYYLEIQNYGSATGFGFDISAKYNLNNKLSSAVNVSNINEPKLGQTRERLPAYFTLGLAYKIYSDTEINFDIVKESGFDFDYRFGINYHFKRWLTLSSGFRDQVNSFSAGFELLKNSASLGYAFVYHPQLGGSNSISMGYAF